MNECTRRLTHLQHILHKLNIIDIITEVSINIYNDNVVVVECSRNQTTKKLQHIQMRKNAIREGHKAGHINVLHIIGKLNPPDMFTKNEKSAHHFEETRD